MANEHVENYTSEDNESIAGNTSVIVWTMKRGLHSLMTMGTSLDKAKDKVLWSQGTVQLPPAVGCG